jgi:hypothetical protein
MMRRLLLSSHLAFYLRKSFIRLLQISLVIVGACLLAKPIRALDDGPAPPQRNGQLFFSIPVGSDGVHYAGVDSGEPWGPGSLAVAADGTIWVADTQDQSLLHYEHSGKFLGRTSLAGQVSAIRQVVPMGDRLALLDYSPDGSQILLVTAEGVLISRQILADERAVTSLLVDDNGDLILVHDGGVAMTRLMSYEGEVYADSPSRTRALVFPNQQVGVMSHTASLAIDKNLATINSSQIIVGVMVLALGASDSYVLTAEVPETGPFVVTHTVHHFNDRGVELGSAALDASDSFTYVENKIAITPTGSVVALLTFEDHAELRTLPFTGLSRAVSVLARGTTVPETAAQELESQDSNASTGCVARSDMIAVTNTYVNNSTFVSAGSIDIGKKNCPGRTKPRFLTTPKVYPSVAYSWGGFDTVEQYNKEVAGGTKDAGNVKGPQTLSCSAGIDCSGLVSRAWGLLEKAGTDGLVGISVPVPNNMALLPGDIMDRPGDHVAMVAGNIGSNGAMFVEATTGYSGHPSVGVMLWPRPWDSFPKGYQRLRYKHVCEPYVGSYVGSYTTTEVPTDPELPLSGPVTFTIAVLGTGKLGEIYGVNVTQPFAESTTGTHLAAFDPSVGIVWENGTGSNSGWCGFTGSLTASATGGTTASGTWLCSAVLFGDVPQVGTWTAVKQVPPQ